MNVFGIACRQPGLKPARWLIFAAASLFLLLNQGCASNLSPAEVEPGRFLHDEAFPASTDVAVETRDEVFKLDRDAKIYLDRKIVSIRDFHKRGRALLNEIFHQASLNLSYASNANLTASEAFHDRKANCLSLSILAYAMAQHAGFTAEFQEVYVPEYWERRDGFSLMNKHVNLRITPQVHTGTVLMRKISFEIDFQPLAGGARPPVRKIPQYRVLAMFYNNKGIDAMLAGEYDRAYAYLRAALLEDPTLDMALANLGLLYAHNEQPLWAEENYRQALRLNGENTVAAESLAILMRNAGRYREADTILARLDRKRKQNPYYHYIRGEEAYDAGNWRAALVFFERSIALKPDVDVFHFGLAKTHYRLGNGERAAMFLRRAERYADYPDLKEKYRGKIEALADL